MMSFRLKSHEQEPQMNCNRGASNFGGGMHRTTILIALALLGTVALGAAPAWTQTKDQITGGSCKALLRSCMRICIRHQGEPDYRGCQADCSNGNRSCKSTLTWKSKNATITVQSR